MRCVVFCGSTSFSWLVFFFGALLWGSMVHKHTGRWMWRGSVSVVSWNWEKDPCHPNAAVVSAILDSISGLEPSSVITEPGYLKLVTVSSFYPFSFICVLVPLCWSTTHNTHRDQMTGKHQNSIAPPPHSWERFANGKKPSECRHSNFAQNSLLSLKSERVPLKNATHTTPVQKKHSIKGTSFLNNKNFVHRKREVTHTHKFI